MMRSIYFFFILSLSAASASCKGGRQSDSILKEDAQLKRKLVIYLDDIYVGKNAEDGLEQWKAKIYLKQFAGDAKTTLIKETKIFKTSDFHSGKTFITIEESQIDAFRIDRNTPVILSIRWDEIDDGLINGPDNAGSYMLYLGSKELPAVFTMTDTSDGGSSRELLGSPFTVDAKSPYLTDINMTAHWVTANLEIQQIAIRRGDARRGGGGNRK